MVAAQEAARTFLRELPRNIDVGLVTFAGTAQVAQQATRSSSTTADASRRPRFVQARWGHLNRDRSLRIGEIYDRTRPGAVAMGTMLAWVAITFAAALAALRAREKSA